jgi:drug/metabolite transporter (DMT)-like permease
LSNPSSSSTNQSTADNGWLFGLLGVIGFSFTLPATRLAVATLDPIIVGLGRALVAACFAAPLLWITRQPRPTRLQWRSIVIVLLGAVIGFPVLTAWAMREVPASHGAIVLGLLPLATAIAGALRAHERPSFAFWISSFCGSGAVVAYALYVGGGALHAADLILFGAVLSAALGYAEGARVGRTLGGWQVICWTLVLSVPVLVWPVGLAIAKQTATVSTASWLGFAYVSTVSMFLAFLAWFHGLATGGVARVSQLQLLQPFLTLAFSAAFLGEQFGIAAVLSTGVVALSILISRGSRVVMRKV